MSVHLTQYDEIDPASVKQRIRKWFFWEVLDEMLRFVYKVYWFLCVAVVISNIFTWEWRSMIVDVTEMLESYWAWFVSLHVAISFSEFAVDLKEAVQVKKIKKLPFLLQDSRSNVLVLQPCSSESAIKCIVGWTCDISWIFMFELWMYGFVEFFIHVDTRF
jgi:hypothetical protein